MTGSGCAWSVLSEGSHALFHQRPHPGQDVKAIYRDGVLTVTIPKSESVKPKRISVEAG